MFDADMGFELEEKSDDLLDAFKKIKSKRLKFPKAKKYKGSGFHVRPNLLH